jgi:NDP-sugar pyrophosphorylase family protein
MEALLLAGGKAERLGEAAQGLPKPLVPVGGFPLAEYTVARLVGAGVTRVIVACRSGQEEAFVNALGGTGAGATIVVAQVRSPFGVVDLEEDGRVTGFREAPLLDDWVNSGVYTLGEEALARLPEKGDHEQSTFPELAAEGKLRGFRHGGVWLTVNTPKDLRRAEDYMNEHPEWRPKRRLS